MARSVFCLDITDFRPMVSSKALEFLKWVTRGKHADPVASTPADETVSSRLQSGSGGGSLDLIGAWYAAGVTGHDQFRAFSMYECLGGWDGGWRSMMELYQGVPESLFLSAIDGLRFQATTVPLVGAPGCPDGQQLRDDGIQGPFAMVEFSSVQPGAGLDYLAAVRGERAPLLADHGMRLAGLYEVAFTRTQVCTLWTGDVNAHVSLLRGRDAALGLDEESLADPRLLSWEKRSNEFLAGDSRELMLAAYPGPLLSPS